MAGGLLYIGIGNRGVQKDGVQNIRKYLTIESS